MSPTARIDAEDPSHLVATGDFIPWDGGCLLIVRAARVVSMHAHYAIQVAFGAEPGIRFRAGDQDAWTAYRGAMISSRHPHATDATHLSAHAVIFIDPATREGRALQARGGPDGITALDDRPFEAAAAKLFATWHRHGNAEATRLAGRQVVKSLTDTPHALPTADERILRAVEYINTHLDTPLGLERVANAACLSPGRFRHLFVEQTRTSLRAYILWRRFIRAWEAVVDGARISTAAHLAGFADAAHFTRTSQRMFGFPPSALRLNERRWAPAVRLAS